MNTSNPQCRGRVDRYQGIASISQISIEADILSRLSAKLADIQLPGRIFVTDALPRNAMEKQPIKLHVQFNDTLCS